MFARAIALSALVLNAYVRHAKGTLTCGNLQTTNVPSSDVEISRNNAQGGVYFNTDYPQAYNGNIFQEVFGVASTSTKGSVCIQFTALNLTGGGNIFFGSSTANTGAGTDTIVQTFSGSELPKPFTFSDPSNDAHLPLVKFTTGPAGEFGQGFQFTCTPGACPCTVEDAVGGGFDQVGNVIASNGLPGTITANAGTTGRCLEFSNIDLQGGSITYKGQTYTDPDKFGPFSLAAGATSQDIIYQPGPTGDEGSFTLTCSQGPCLPSQLSPCTVVGSTGAIDSSDQIYTSKTYPLPGFAQGDNAIVTITGPACVTFDDTQGYGINGGTLSYQDQVLSNVDVPGPFSVPFGQSATLDWSAAAAGSPGFKFFCNFGTCDSQTTTTTSAPTTTSTTTSASTTSTTSAPSSTSTTTTTQTTVEPFPVSSCTKKSCRGLVKRKKQRLFAAAGCGDSTSCKNTVKATMPFNGNKKKACKPKRRQDVCQNIYWYT